VQELKTIDGGYLQVRNQCKILSEFFPEILFYCYTVLLEAILLHVEKRTDFPIYILCLFFRGVMQGR
jgi:hypothetical protein